MQVKLTNVRLSYPHIFEQAMYNGKPIGYEVTLILEPTHPCLLPLREAIYKVGVAAYGVEEWKQKYKNFVENSRIPLKTGKEAPGYEGNFYIQPRSKKQKPPAFDQAAQPVTCDTGLFYGGCYVNAVIDIWSTKKYDFRICASLQGIQFARDGEPFGAQRISANAFDDLTKSDKNMGGMGNSAADFYDEMPF